MNSQSLRAMSLVIISSFNCIITNSICFPKYNSTAPLDLVKMEGNAWRSAMAINVRVSPGSLGKTVKVNK